MKIVVRMYKWILYIAGFILLLICSQCKENTEDQPNVIIETQEPQNITHRSVILKGKILNNGGLSFSIRGVCIHDEVEPTFHNGGLISEENSDEFSVYIDSLNPNTYYTYRAYATDGINIYYGEILSFNTNSIIPIVLTGFITSVGVNTATVSDNTINNDGGLDITSKGVCWSTSPNPTIEDNATFDGTGASNFTSELNGLTESTTYFVRAYATNEIGTGYGEEREINTDGVEGMVTDIDGNKYETIWIGGQNWMSENLKTTSYNNGLPVELVTDHTEWQNKSTGAYCWFNNNPQYAETHGALYNWYAVNTDILCPSGWHVATDEEWTALEDYIASDGHSNAVGTALKSTYGWNGDGNGTDDYGFTALAGGYRDRDGLFLHFGNYGYWWTGSAFTSYVAWRRYMLCNTSDVSRGSHHKRHGFSVRCLMD